MGGAQKSQPVIIRRHHHVGGIAQLRLHRAAKDLKHPAARPTAAARAPAVPAPRRWREKGAGHQSCLATRNVSEVDGTAGALSPAVDLAALYYYFIIIVKIIIFCIVAAPISSSTRASSSQAALEGSHRHPGGPRLAPSSLASRRWISWAWALLDGCR